MTSCTTMHILPFPVLGCKRKKGWKGFKKSIMWKPYCLHMPCSKCHAWYSNINSIRTLKLQVKCLVRTILRWSYTNGQWGCKSCFTISIRDNKLQQCHSRCLGEQNKSTQHNLNYTIAPITIIILTSHNYSTTYSFPHLCFLKFYRNTSTLPLPLVSLFLQLVQLCLKSSKCWWYGLTTVVCTL